MVDNPQTGVIVQKITRTFDVRRVSDDHLMTAAELDAYVPSPSTVYAGDTVYWELWTVDAEGNVSDGGQDTFGLCSLIPDADAIHASTKGTFRMVGSATFHVTTASPADFGFRQGAVATAGDLWSTTAQPAGLPAAASGPVTYTVTVTWDTTSSENKKQWASKVAES